MWSSRVFGGVELEGAGFAGVRVHGIEGVEEGVVGWEGQEGRVCMRAVNPACRLVDVEITTRTSAVV